MVFNIKSNIIKLLFNNCFIKTDKIPEDLQQNSTWSSTESEYGFNAGYYIMEGTPHSLCLNNMVLLYEDEKLREDDKYYYKKLTLLENNKINNETEEEETNEESMHIAYEILCV